MSNEFFNVVRLTKKNDNPVFTYYYNPIFDLFGNKEDFFTNDDYDMVLVDATLSAQEIDSLFDKNYNF